MDHVHVIVTGVVDGEVRTMEQDGRTVLMFMVATRVWDGEQPTEMRHAVVYPPVSERQANFLRETLTHGTQVLASGGLKPMVVQRDQPAGYIITAKTVEVDSRARMARQEARARSAEPRQQERHAPEPEPAHREQPQSRSGWRPVERQRSQPQPSAPSRPAPPSGGYDRDYAPARPAPAPARPAQAPARQSSGQGYGYGSSNRSSSSQYRSSQPQQRPERPGPTLDF